MKTTLTSLTVLTAATLGNAAAAQDTFVISWWGFNGDLLQEIVVDPFQETCDCEVVFETGNNADRLGKLTARGGAGVDVIYLTDSFSQIGAESGVFQPIDRSLIPNIGKLYELAQAPQGEFGPAYTIGRVGIVYDSEEVEPITAWSDLWRADLDGQISLPGITTTAGPMVVVQAGREAGVDPYQETDAAFEKVAALAPNVVKNYNTGSEMINLMSTDEVDVSLAQDFALSSLQEAVPSIVWADLEDGDIATLNTINIPTGAANVELAHEFIDFVLSTEIQQALAEAGVDAPVNTEVTLTEEQAAGWTYGPEAVDALNRMDYELMNIAKPEWIDRWNEVFGG
jgi:putative spermidine/putrescine transport system substrate-binding protein